MLFSQGGLARLREGLMRAGLDARHFVWPPEDDPQRPPYRGLAPMEAEDAGIFYGREAPTIAVLDRLRGLAQAAAPRLLAIIGASGAGKSSFLRAGLAPRLRRDDRNFLMLPILRPERAALSGEDGLVRVLEAAAKSLGLAKSRADIRSAVQAGAGAVSSLLGALAGTATPPDTDDAVSGRAPRLVLAIDQGEELFLAEGQEEANAFLALMRDLAAAPESDLIVLFTIRSDSFERLQTAPALEGLNPQTFSLPPMPRGAYQTVIEGPAKRLADSDRALTIEPALTAALLADIEAGGGKDALPLLAFTLERLYVEYGGGGALTLAQYRDLGGISGSIEAAVEGALKASDGDPAVPRDRAARLALLRRALIPWLAGIDPESGSPRRRVARLAEMPEEARPLVGYLIAARLLSTDVAPETGERTVEPAHEALLRQWGLLQGWLEEDFAALATLEGIQRAARDWAANAKDEAWLAHTAGRLEDAEAVARRGDFLGLLETTDRDYLAAARTADDARRNRELEEARQLAAAQKKVAQRTRIGLVAASVLLVAAAGAAVFGFQKAQEARNQTAIAEAKTVVAIHNETVGLAALSMVALDQGRPADAVKLALAAWPRTGRTDRPPLKMTVEALGTALPHLRQRHVLKPGGTLKTAVFSPDGSRVLTISSDGNATFWDAETGAELTSLKADDAAIESAAFSPDGSRVVIASANGVVRIWDVAKGSVVALLKGHDKKVNDAVFSPDGKLVATASDDKTARIWDATTGAQLHVLEHKDEASLGNVDLVVFSPDGTRIATKTNFGPTTMWDIGTGTELFTVAPNFLNNLDSVSFAPDGKHFVSASKSNAGIWDATTGALVAVLRGHKDWLTSVAFSPDGRHVVTAAADRTARIWDAGDGHQTAVLEGHTDFLLSATYSRSGDRILTASADGTARIWDAATGKTVAILQRHDGQVFSASFSPNATRVVTASTDGTARLWDATVGPAAVVLHHDDKVQSVAFSPDGTRLVTGSDDHTARIWNAATGAESTALKGPVQISLVLFSPDGKRVLTVGINTQIWDSASGVQLATLGSEDAFHDTAAFSPDGTRVVTGTLDDGKVSIWNAETGALVVPLEGPETTVRDVAFSPDGKRVVTAEDDHTARIWDATTGTQLAVLKHANLVLSASFSPDGSLVATASSDGTAAIWDAHTGARSVVLHHDAQVVSVAFSPDGKRVVTGSDDRTARIWNTATGKAMGVLRGHTASVRSAVFSPDGTRVLTASDDGTARIWDAETGVELAALVGHGDKVSSAVFSPDGTRVATASLDGTARIWDVSHVEQGNAFAIACRRLGNDTELGAARARYGLGNLVPVCGDHPSQPVDWSKVK